MQLLLALTTIASLVFHSQQMLFNSQLNNPTARFSSISEAYLSLSGQSLLLLSKKDNSSAARILDMSLANGTLVVDNSYESGVAFSSYWQIYHLEKEIMSFAISISERAEFYTSQPQPSITASYNDIFFRGVWLTTKKIGYFSTIKGTIAYADKNGLQNNQFTFLENSHHIGSTFLSLSPD